MKRVCHLVALCGCLTVSGTAAAQSIFTIAGGGVADGRPATIVGLSPTSVASDGNGNLFIADSSDHRVRYVAPSTGIIQTVAGDGTEGFGGDGGPATAASLNSPSGITLAENGDLYIADSFNLRIRRVDAATGFILTIAGNGERGFSGDGGSAIDASFSTPLGIAVDPAGNIFVADRNNHRVRRIDPNGIITTVAGNGEIGFSGDGGPATEASFAGNPSKPALNIAVDQTGNLYIADADNHRVRRVDASTGIITTIAGIGSPGFGGDGGPATQASFNRPDAIAFDSSGNLFIADTDNIRIRRVDAATGIITTVAGSGDWGFAGDGGPATEARFKSPDVIAVDNEFLYIGDRIDHRVRRVSRSAGTITTIAGNGSRGFTGDDGLASEALLSRPSGVAIDPDGRLIIADAAGQRVRRVDLESEIITTVSGNGSFGSDGDGGLAVDAEHEWPISVDVDAAGNLYICDRFTHSVRRIDATTGIIMTVAGTGGAGFAGDGGPATAASLSSPDGIAVSPQGDLYIADTSNNRVRHIDAGTGVISTIAGNGTAGLAGDGGPATEASLASPTGVALDAVGNVYIADQVNHRIRRVDAETGIITTVAGSSEGSDGDGGQAVDARLRFPSGIDVGSDNSFYVVDTFNDRVRRVDMETGIISTLAGSGARGFVGDAGPATSAAMTVPRDVAVDLSGNVYIADTNSNRVRVVFKCVDVEGVDLATPSDGASGLSASPSLRWSPPAGAFRYDLYVDVVSPPERLVAKDIDTASFALTNLAPLTAYYWRVVAKGDPFCEPFRTSESEIWSFTTTSSCEKPTLAD